MVGACFWCLNDIRPAASRVRRLVVIEPLIEPGTRTCTQLVHLPEELMSNTVHVSSEILGSAVYALAGSDTTCAALLRDTVNTARSTNL